MKVKTCIIIKTLAPNKNTTQIFRELLSIEHLSDSLMNKQQPPRPHNTARTRLTTNIFRPQPTGVETTVLTLRHNEERMP